MGLANYFDLNAPPRDTLRPAVKKAKAWPQWFAMLLGIFIQPYLAQYRVTGEWNFTGSWGWLLFSAFIGIAIFPTVYREAFNTKQPWIILLAPSFVAGLGWEAIFTAAAKAGSKLVTGA